MPRNTEDEQDFPRDFAFLEGRILRLEAEQKSIRRVHGELATEVERLNVALRQLREENDSIDPWRETTDIRNQRRAELDSLRVRAREADLAEIHLKNEKAVFLRRLAVLAPSLAAVLYGLAELVKSLIHH
jgi:hypothetical protein